MQSSAKVDAGGEAVASPGFEAHGWYQAELPATALGTLVEAGEYPDIFHGTKLREVPGQGPRAQNFSNHKMPEDSPFAVPWWFRRSFRLDPKELAAGERVSLEFDGVNYRARVWLNGSVIAEPTEIVGTYREFEVDITDQLSPSGDNVLALELFAPKPCDLSNTWVDWNPSPSDKNMGIWRDVWLTRTGPAALRHPAVLTALEADGSARLTVLADLENRGDEPVTALVHGEFEGHRFSKTVTLAPQSRARVLFTAEDAPCLHVREPELWWPRHLGDPALHRMALEVEVGGVTSDAEDFEFGIRTVEGVRTEEGYAALEVNGQRVLIRGAGWAPDLFLRRDRAREWAQIDYVLDMNLDTIRFEGMLERAEFLERCDREGIMVIAGWCCCDQWEKWAEWKQENFVVGPESLRSQVRRTRRHPCMVAWWYGSDFAPPPEVERSYLAILEEEAWPNAYHSSASHRPAEMTGDCGMKMLGPYEYVPPNYWLEDTERGGAFGFATEICSGPAVPPIESLRKMLPAESLWPVDETWHFHAGGQEFHNIDMFTQAVEARYGELGGVEDFAQLSQLLTYECQRAMFEAYTRNKTRAATGVVQWMLNNAWPSIIWHVYDYYLRPGGGYFGTKKACEPVHALYTYDDRGVWIDNSLGEGFEGLRAAVRVFDLDSKLIHERRDRVDVAANGQRQVTTLPDFADHGPLVFVELSVSSSAGERLSHNVYALPARLDELEHDKGTWYYTPVARHADLRALRQLPPAELAVRVSADEGDRGDQGWVAELENTGEALVFFAQLRLTDAAGEDLLPVLYSDNYLSVMPGEAAQVRVSLPGGAAIPADARLEIGAINLEARSHRPPEEHGGATASAGAGGAPDPFAGPVDAEVLVFGATGDLAYRKLFRALYQLVRAGDLSRSSGLHGVALGAMSRDQFNQHVAEAITETLTPRERDPLTTAAFVGAWHYDDLGEADGVAWSRLAERLRGSTKPRLIYLATSSAHYGSLCDGLAGAGLITPGTRLVIEKPIGHDSASAERINADVARHFDEGQVFRIDHYLGKETVQNLLALRFANVLFEPLWRNTVVEEVQITVAEDMGVEGRLDFYERTGALRDMVQSHLLQLVCLVAMEVPHALTAEAVRAEKLKVMSALRPIRGAEVDRCTVRAQYEGYGLEHSETETYAAIRAEVANWRWAGVPFYLRTGKMLSRRRSRISLKFREVPQSIFPGSQALRANQLDLLLQPDDGIRLKLMAKEPGHGMALHGANLSLDFHEHDDRRRPYSYERLLRDALRGDSTLFVHRREVELGWAWVDPIIEHWRRRGRSGLLRYAPGSAGPSGADRLFGSRSGWDDAFLSEDPKPPK
ncbi:glycoside hydrolase family 2, sugar binding protein [Plesiocystis pacifica SIR-1]|uniref:Glucose-6-phosphate 1-dehydrogenase n=1 Tax=Plesiocystis pacifica SIR-1 TaxID=391625 RepID=A6FX54_9BACT|nr:glucose-6-phosphate dehydrogenase [Plesiocystis pacifica]EDM81878.1 glycoside hydrolase family 2, sugar binding protein [Plesiocystis pacifica SIR-1]